MADEKKNKVPKKDDVDLVTTYISEGNPNTQPKIEEAQKVDIAQTSMVTQLSRDEKPVPPGDPKLAADVKKAIEKEDSIAPESKTIEVSAQKGVVTLKGRVKSEKEKMTMGDKAAAFAGFKKVKNRLTPKEKTK